MIFSELYSAYYKAVAKIIKTAIDHPLEKGEIRKIVEENAFRESILSIEPAIAEQRWQIIRPDGTTNIKNMPDMPLTLIQRRWIKAIMLDPRIRLFSERLPDDPGVEPLFTPEDYTVFDQYADGDQYTEETYQRNFRQIMDAIKNSHLIKIEVDSRRGRAVTKIVIPQYLEYSEKDDKFRLIASGRPFGGTYNLGRIKSCVRFEGDDTKEDMNRHRSQIPMARMRFFVFVQVRIPEGAL